MVDSSPSIKRLQVLILTLDEEDNLPTLLGSLQGLEADLFVMDSGSRDRTIEIAEAAGATIFTHAFDDYGSQRNRAQDLLPDQFGWVLHLDADESLTPELASEIAAAMKDPEPRVDGYLLRQRTVFMGRWIKHGGHYPAHHLRLFNVAKGRCEDRLYDQHFVVDGRIDRMTNDYIDSVTSDLATWTTRHARWAQLEAEESTRPQSGERRVSPRLGGDPIQRKRWLRERVLMRSPLFFRAFAYWFYRYFLRAGFLDGKEGLVFHFLQAYWYRFLVDALIYERTHGESGKKHHG